MKLDIKLKKAESLSDFLKKLDGSLALYQPYFHEIQEKKFHLRVITPQSNIEWIKKEIGLGHIWIVPDRIIAEHI